MRNFLDVVLSVLFATAIMLLVVGLFPIESKMLLFVVGVPIVALIVYYILF